MKKLSITIAIILGMSITAFAAPDGGGLFQRGMVPDEEYFGSRINERPIMPYHELNTNQPATTPLGSGIAVLIGFGFDYNIWKNA